MDQANHLVIGLPRAMLYARYHVLWQTFFRELGMETTVSPPTSRQLLESGSALAADEACLSAKIFFGHVQALLGQCDYILVPRVSNFGRRRNMCTRFEALYDLTCTAFRDSGQKFLSYNVDVLEGLDEQTAFLTMAQTLGHPKREAKRAYAAAKKEEQRVWKEKLRRQEALLRGEGLKLLVAAHSYLLQDHYTGRMVLDLLKKMDVIPLSADVVDRDTALRRSVALSPTCKWEISRELIGSIAMHRDNVDGIILLSAFPCGPDAMVNELLTRKLKDIPLLHLVLDSQSGTAGIETRLESFVDIIRLKKGVLY